MDTKALKGIDILGIGYFRRWLPSSASVATLQFSNSWLLFSSQKHCLSAQSQRRVRSGAESVRVLGPA